MADLSSIGGLLSQTLQPDASVRRNAEAQLRQVSQTSGFGSHLVQLAVSEQTPPELRLAAAVTLKNFAKENWNKEKCEIEISDIDRANLHNEALQCMYATAGNIRKQMSEVVCTMGKYDFPHEWPQLITVLVGYMRIEEMDKLIATLTAMDELFRRYRHESKSNQLWTEIVVVLQNAAAPLTAIFGAMLEQIPRKDTMSEAECVVWLEVLLLIIEIFHSLNAQDLPEYFEDNINIWMNGSLALLSLKVPVIEANALETEPNVLDKLKCAVCEVVTLYSQRYEEEVAPFLSSITENIWQLLVEMDFRTRYDTLVDAALGFLSAICMRPQYSEMFEREGVLKTLCEDVVIKNLMLRQCDIEQFDDEPLEFIKRDIEGSDVGTRRRGAGDFVRALCRRFEGPVTNILSSVISVYLQECALNLNANWLKKDVIYCIVTAIASKAETMRFGATSTSELIDVVDFYNQHVRTDLFAEDVNALSVLRTDALKYVVTFRNQLLPQQIVESLGPVARLFSSNHSILHQYAAYAIERLMMVKIKGTNQTVISRENTQVGPLIATLFAVFDCSPQAHSSHYLMKALMRCLNIMDTETAKKSGEIVNKLATMIAVAVKNPVDPLHLHFMFESLCIIIRQAYSLVEGGIDQFIIPVIESIFSNEIIEYIPYALQITASLLDQAHSNQSAAVDNYLLFLSFLMNENLWMQHANIPAGILVIESFMRCRSERVLSDYSQKLVAILTRLISSKAQDQHGFKLGNTLMLFTNNNVNLTDASILTPMLRRVQFAKTAKFMKQFVIFLCRFTIVRGALALLDALESLQIGMYQMVVEKILFPELMNMCNTTTYEEKRICCIGVSNLLSDTTQFIGDVYSQLVEAIVNLMEASGSGPIAPQEEEAVGAYAEVETEYNDPYCKLTYAQHPDAVAPEISNFKAFLGRAVLVKGRAAKPESVDSINEQIRRVLTNYMQSQMYQCPPARPS